MEWNGWPSEEAVSSDYRLDENAYSYNIAPHSCYDAPHFQSIMPRSYSDSYPYEENHGYSYDFDTYSAASYMQTSVADYQAPTMPIPAAPRVHINPNYRPKTSLGLEKDTSSSRPVNVHINPHWKPRVETIAEKGSSLQRDNCSSESLGKKTIFVNPKVLAHINSLKPIIQSQCSVPKSDFSSTFSVPTIKCLVKKTNIQEAKFRTKNERIVIAPATEPSFVILSSKKLIRKPNIISHQKPLNSIPADILVLCNDTIGTSTEENCKRSNPPCAPTVKIAKQVSSKYKLVRNSSSVQNSTKQNVRGASTHSSRRMRKRSLNSGIHSTPSKSVYKFIRKPGVNDSVMGSSASRKNGNVVLFASQSSQRQNSSATRKETNTGSARRNVKTQYRLVKLHPTLQQGQTATAEKIPGKGIQSRYKIVRQGFAGVKPSVQMNSTSVCGFPLYSSLVRSKFKSLVGKSSYGRRVSRFRIIQTSKSRMMTQGLVKVFDCHQRSKLTMPVFQRSGSYRNISWQKDNILPFPQSPATNSKRKGSGNTPTAKLSNKSLVNIGGVLYRSTRTSLTRTHREKSKEQIVHIRGKRFVLDGQGKTLRPATSNSDTGHLDIKNGKVFSFARVDIGGVTFTRRSDNTLVRTNSHYARNLLSIAKTRSIALLTDKLRKNNQPCLIYHRFGKCRAQEKGKCWRLHDPKNIAICRKFLQGSCLTENCLLSHNVGPEKMPTCHYFLEGCCVRDNCPYLHVKLSARAAICRQFLNGYCAAGDMCKKRHVNLCPEFEKDRKCSKGEYCPYPHKGSDNSKPKGKATTFTTKNPSNIIKESDEFLGEKEQHTTSGEAEKRKRYYDESSERQIEHCEGKEVQSEALRLDTSEGDLNHEESLVAQKRPKIGILPAYIPLE